MRESRYNIWVDSDTHAYIFGGVSGALLRIPKDARDSLQRYLDYSDPNCDPKLLLDLAKGRMLVSNDCDELELLKSRYDSDCQDTSHLALTVVTSLGCNFNCSYCFEKKCPSIISRDVQYWLLKMLDDYLPQISLFHVTWFGGEPLIGKTQLLNLSKEFIERCNKANIKYQASIVSNGYLLDARTCVDLHNSKITAMQITLDGPPDIHDKMRPLANGNGTFWKIIENLHHAIKYFDITIRISLNGDNFHRVEELLQILADEGFAGKLSVYPGRIQKSDENIALSSAHYMHCCLAAEEFAILQYKFVEMAREYGFSSPFSIAPLGTHCMAMRLNDFVVGSDGNLYKCWESTGNISEAVGNIQDYRNLNSLAQKWLNYSPFEDEECCNCIALPICMGGCTYRAKSHYLHKDRCDTFRYAYQEQLLAFVHTIEDIELKFNAGR